MIPLLFAVAMVQPAVPFTTLDHGATSGIEERRQVVVRSQAEWEALWREHAPGRPVPKVDFTRQMVLGVFAGTLPTAGYDVTITKVRTERDGLTVEWVLHQPGRDTRVAQVLTAPFHLVATDRREGRVGFETPGEPAR